MDEGAAEAMTEENQEMGAGSDTLLKIVEQRAEALSDSREVSRIRSDSKGKDKSNNPIHTEARHAVNAMLEDLHWRCTETAAGSTSGDPLSGVDLALDLGKDHVALCTACTKLTGMCKDKSLDVIYCAQITVMVGVLNLHLKTDLHYTWRNASLIVAKARGQGTMHACNLHKWVLEFV